MNSLSQEEINKLLSLEAKPNPKAASTGVGSEPRFRRFANLSSKSISADSACNLTQDEVDRVFACRDSAGNHEPLKI